MDEAARAWWKEATVYQVYPRSFADGDGDGVGDLSGLASRADYLADLGVDVGWLTPVYESPMADNGYDVADYRAVDDTFGSMADWRAVRDALHERDIRLVMDFVPNHTSDEHAWFRASRAREDGKADWYHWADGVDADTVAYDAPDEGPSGEAPPNNWRSFFGGPAWTYDDERGQWYLHLFDPKQPDLDWSVPAVRAAIHDELRYWLDEGIDGFRLDVVNLLSKPDGYPSGDESEPFNGSLRLVPDGSRIHEYVSGMSEAVFAGHDLLTVGECIGDLSVEEAARYVEPDGDGLSMVFHFGHVGIGRGDALWEREPWSLTDLKAVFDRWQNGLAGRGWNSLYFENHDQPRVVSRFGDDGDYRLESATCIATLLHTLCGTPYVYQGQELGQTNPTFESLAEFRDVETVRTVEEALAAGEIESFDDVRDGLNAHSRDTSRTPMQWTDGPNAGFTDPDAEPWIRLHEDYREVNVEAQRSDPDSVWHYYRRLIDLRAANDVLVYGAYENHTPEDEQVWAYSRTLGDEAAAGAESDRAFVALNWGGEPARVEPPASLAGAAATLALSNRDGAPAPERVEPYTARPWEARVYLLD
ncbi:alpha-glucosidase [Halobaculum lipolyticum]|uniref:Alpha-glucosidase n=1 Tax=Halobaculum lipolyticum TaxID=3032001 RepID=A0ABD5W9V7_9EURY|nr:alpha-glucosidase [Halobaculum sp. DT31]